MYLLEQHYIDYLLPSRVIIHIGYSTWVWKLENWAMAQITEYPFSDPLDKNVISRQVFSSNVLELKALVLNTVQCNPRTGYWTATIQGTAHFGGKQEGWGLEKVSNYTPLEFDFDLLLLWFETVDLSFTCFLATPVTTSYIVGRSFIMLKRRFLEERDPNSAKRWNTPYTNKSLRRWCKKTANEKKAQKDWATVFCHRIDFTCQLYQSQIWHQNKRKQRVATHHYGQQLEPTSPFLASHL